MAKDLTNSVIDRQNILNNDMAIEEIKKNISVPGIVIDDKIYFTVEYVASFYEVDPRTIRRYIENNSKEFNENGKSLAAICAAPTVLGAAGLLNGRKAACYPGCEDGLTGAEVLTDRVVEDGNITTSRGVGTAIPFALSLISQLFSPQKAEEIRESIVYGHGPVKA